MLTSNPRSNFLGRIAIDLELLFVLFLDHAYDSLAVWSKILNLTGFCKASRKYGKITKTSVLGAYMKEKVSTHTGQ
jgi:hypothetical protein